MKIRFLMVVTILASVLFLSSCMSYISQLKARSFDHTITLRVNGGQLDTETKPRGNCKKDGCVEVGVNQSATIKFDLRANKKWRLTEFRICEGTTKGDVCQLSDRQTSEFVAYERTHGPEIFPDEQGLINLELLSSNPVKKFFVYDFNSFKSDYYYSITACPPGPADSDDCIKLDPPIVNKGKNNIL